MTASFETNRYCLFYDSERNCCTNPGDADLKEKIKDLGADGAQYRCLVVLVNGGGLVQWTYK